MSEWMTTGQVIDKLKIGEVAKNIDRVKTEYIVRTEDGYYWGTEVGTYRDILKINDVVSEMKWRILPKYVSLGKAMKALKEGYTVRCYPEDDGGYLEFNEADTLRTVADGWTGITWGTFIEGKWTIEEDEQ